MERNGRHPCIVVGYDGSPASRAAVDWAAGRAGHKGRVVVVHAFKPPPESFGSAGYQARLDASLGRGRELLTELNLQEGNALMDVDHDVELIAGRPAETIARVAETRGADEIVVGSRGFGRVRGTLGSVSHELIRIVDRPLTVIPERAVAARPGAGPA